MLVRVQIRTLDGAFLRLVRNTDNYLPKDARRPKKKTQEVHKYQIGNLLMKIGIIIQVLKISI